MKGDRVYLPCKRNSTMFNKRESENMETTTNPSIPAMQYLPLEQVNKPVLTTAELAYYSNMTAQAWRVKACYDTAPEGLRPLRVCGKLAWPTAGAKKLLGVTA
jgi:hypothetical protein